MAKTIREFWLVATARIDEINVPKQEVSLHLYTKFYFQQPDLLTLIQEGKRAVTIEGSALEPAEAIKRLKAGERIDGAELSAQGSDVFPVNPSKPLLNTIQSQVAMPPWLRFNVANGTVSAQYVLSHVVSAPMRLHRFPFDRQMVPLKVGVRLWKQEGVQHKWTLLQSVPEWAPQEYPEDRSIITEELANVADDEFIHLTPFVVPDLKPVMYLRLQRNPIVFLASIGVPVFGVVLMSMASFFLMGDMDGSMTRLNSTTTSLLTVVAFKLVIQDKIPNKSYLTLADYYFFFTILFCLVQTIKTVSVAHLTGHGAGFFFVGVNPTTEEEVGRTADMLDDISTWVLMSMWIFLHAGVLLMQWCCPDCARVGWDDLLDETSKDKSKVSHGTVGLPMKVSVAAATPAREPGQALSVSAPTSAQKPGQALLS